MALVVLLRGVNVGGHRTFRPSALAKELAELDVVNIGAAGTFVVRAPVTEARARAELASRLPFETEIVIRPGREFVRAMSPSHFAGQPESREVVRFVSTLAAAPRSAPELPSEFTHDGQWLVRLLARDGRFVFGVYRRHMKAIEILGRIDRLFGASLTTRNWNTIASILAVLEGDA